MHAEQGWYLACLAELGEPVEREGGMGGTASGMPISDMVAECERALETATGKKRMYAVARFVCHVLVGRIPYRQEPVARMMFAQRDGLSLVYRELREAIELERDPIDLLVLRPVVEHLEEVVAAVPRMDLVGALTSLALASCRLGDAPRALHWLDRTIAAASDQAGSEIVDSIGDLRSGWPHPDFAAAFARTGRHDDALAFSTSCLERLAAIDRDRRATVFVQIVRALVALPEQLARRPTIDRALAVADAAGEPRMVGAAIAAIVDVGAAADAERLLAERATHYATDPAGWAPWLFVAGAYQRRGETARAAHHAERAVRAGGDRAAGAFVVVAIRLGLYDDARDVALGREPLAEHELIGVHNAALNDHDHPEAAAAFVDAVLPTLEPPSYRDHTELWLCCFALARGVGDPAAWWTRATGLQLRVQQARARIVDALKEAAGLDRWR